MQRLTPSRPSESHRAGTKYLRACWVHPDKKLLGAKGITTRSKDATRGAPGLTTSSKDITHKAQGTSRNTSSCLLFRGSSSKSFECQSLHYIRICKPAGLNVPRLKPLSWGCKNHDVEGPSVTSCLCHLLFALTIAIAQQIQRCSV